MIQERMGTYWTLCQIIKHHLLSVFRSDA